MVPISRMKSRRKESSAVEEPMTVDRLRMNDSMQTLSREKDECNSSRFLENLPGRVL
jgi:hypothetical protein